jgi:YHS domain-containing protein
MSATLLRKPWVWVLIGVAAVLILFTLLPGDSNDIDRPLSEFIEDARAGRVRSVEVDDTEIEYRLIGDEQTYATKMEEDDTLRQILQDAGIEPEDFPPFRIREPSFWSNIPGLVFSFLPIILFAGLLYYIVCAAVGRGGSKTQDVDPVCGRRVRPKDAAGSSIFQEITYRFCSAECKQQFDNDPVTYLLRR